MPKRSKPPRPADELDPDVVRLLAAAIAPAELAQAEREALYDRIMQRIRGEAISGADVSSGDAAVGHAAADATSAGDAPPAGTVTIRAADMRWVAAGPGVEVKVLRTNAARRDQTVLIRMQPGAVVVGHRHTQEEECLVLEGEVFVGDHRLGAGDMHVAAAGVVHSPIRAPRGALLMIRSEIPPQSFRIA